MLNTNLYPIVFDVTKNGLDIIKQADFLRNGNDKFNINNVQSCPDYYSEIFVFKNYVYIEPNTLRRIYIASVICPQIYLLEQSTRSINDTFGLIYIAGNNKELDRIGSRNDQTNISLNGTNHLNTEDINLVTNVLNDFNKYVLHHMDNDELVLY